MYGSIVADSMALDTARHYGIHDTILKRAAELSCIVDTWSADELNVQNLTAVNKDFTSFNDGQDLKIVGLLSLKRLATDGRLYFDTQSNKMYF